MNKGRRIKYYNYTDSQFEIGTFHGFGVDFEEFDNGPGNFSTAIIERDNGTIIMKSLNYPVAFVDESEAQK